MPIGTILVTGNTREDSCRALRARPRVHPSHPSIATRKTGRVASSASSRQAGRLQLQPQALQAMQHLGTWAPKLLGGQQLPRLAGNSLTSPPRPPTLPPEQAQKPDQAPSLGPGQRKRADVPWVGGPIGCVLEMVNQPICHAAGPNCQCRKYDNRRFAAPHK